MGLSVAVVLTGGEVSDVKGYGPVMAERGPQPKVLLGDKDYDAEAILADLEDRSVTGITVTVYEIVHLSAEQGVSGA